jgi:very-short-patch-repair endonuclease
VRAAIDALERELTARAGRGEVGLIVDVRLAPPRRPGRDWSIAALAERQYGVVARWQLLAAGIGPGAIDTRLKGHRLHRLHRGVYAVGHTALAPFAKEMAAVLACWPGALISHGSAAASIWRLLEPPERPVELTVVLGGRSRRPGLRVHGSRLLAPEEVRIVRGIPVTSPARTLIDLAEIASDRELERAYDEALTRNLATTASVTAAVQRTTGRRGIKRLRALLQRDTEPAFTRSEAEERLLALVRASGLPQPEVNAAVGDHTVDFVWRNKHLAVETDGYRFHSTRAAFERDRLRDADLTARGFRVIRVTWRQLSEQPLAVVARLADALAA